MFIFLLISYIFLHALLFKYLKLYVLYLYIIAVMFLLFLFCV